MLDMDLPFWASCRQTIIAAAEDGSNSTDLGAEEPASYGNMVWRS